jgi:hypothetical protein
MPAAVRGPVLVPPWMRHRPLAIAGDLQGVPLRRFLAPQRGAALAALSAFLQSGIYGLSSDFIVTPVPNAPSDDGLATVADVDVLDGDDLRAAVPELVKCKGALLEGVHHPRR